MVSTFVTHPFRLGNSWFPISLFIFRFKSTSGAEGANPPAELAIDHVIPIFGDFSISVALSRRNTIDLRNPSSPLTRNQPRTGTRLPSNSTALFSPLSHLVLPNGLLTRVITAFCQTELRVTINVNHQSTEDQYTEPITLLANDLQRLRSILAECKRLKQIAGLSFVSSLCPPNLRVAQMRTSTRLRYPPHLSGPCLTSARHLLHSVRHPHLVSPSWCFHGSHRFNQPFYPLIFAYLAAHYTHVFHLRAPVYRVMTLLTFNSSARSGYRKLPGSFVTRQRRGTISGEERPFSRNPSAYTHDSSKDPPWHV